MFSSSDFIVPVPFHQSWLATAVVERLSWHHVLTLLLPHTDGLIFPRYEFIETLMEWVYPSTRRGGSYRWRWSVHHVLLRQLQQNADKYRDSWYVPCARTNARYLHSDQGYSTSASRDDSRGGIPSQHISCTVHLVGFRPPGDLPPTLLLVACGMFVLGMLLTCFM
jgi:hypothetical protein